MITVDFLDVCENQTRLGHKIYVPDYLSNGKYPIVDQSKKYIVAYSNNENGLYSNTPFIIFGDVTRIFKFIDFPCFLGADGSVILKVINPEFDTKYVYYALLNSYVPDTGFNRHYKFLKDIKIRKYSLSEQKRIVDALDNINKAIDLENYRIVLLNELIKSRFKEMFGKCNEKKQLFEVTTKITDGSHNPPKGIAKSEYMMLSSQNIYDELDLSDVRYLSKNDFDRENKRTDIEEGDVLLTIVGTIGRTHVVKKDEKYTFQRSVAVIKPIKALLNGVYLSECLHTDDSINQLESGGHGSSQKGIYLQDLKKILIPIPAIHLQNEFASFVFTIEKTKSTIQKRLALLTELLSKKTNEFFGGDE